MSDITLYSMTAVDRSNQSVCADVLQLSDVKRCQFVRSTADCVDNMYLVNYLSWHYCKVDTRNKLHEFWNTFIITAVCIYVFWMLQVAVSQYFCPALKMIADILKLNENTTGVVLLSLANGSPDIFTAVAGMMTLNKWSFLVCVSQILFLYTFVGGLVIAIHPFDMEPNYFLRDFAFLFLNITYLDFIHKNRPVLSLWEAIPGLFIYVLYIIMAIFDQHLVKSKLKMLERKLSITNNEDPQQGELLALKSLTQLPINRVVVDRTRPRVGNRNQKLFSQFWKSICKFDVDRYKHGSMLVKFFLVVKEPLEMILRICIPIVDVETHNYSWSKLLCCVQFVAAPTYISFILLRGVTVLGTAAYIMTFYVLVPLAFIIFLTTRTDTMPKYFKYTAYVGFIASIFFIFALSCEVSAMFFTIGTILGFSQAFIIATALCWSMNCGDLVSHIAFVRQGLPKMAYTAVFSSPVFGTFVNLFMPLTLGIVFNTNASPRAVEGSFGEFTCIFAEVAMCISFLATLTNNFELRGAFGALLVVYYLFYLLALVLLENDLVLSYGVDA